MFTRRGFLWVCGASAATIAVARLVGSKRPKGMVLLPRGGRERCSFCGKKGYELFGMVGIPGRPEKLCDECLGCMLDIIATEPVDRWPTGSPDAACSFCDRPQRAVRMLIRGPVASVCDGCVEHATRLFVAAERHFSVGGRWVA